MPEDTKSAKIWYVRLNEQSASYGPYTMWELREYIHLGRLKTDLFASKDKKNWGRLGDIFISTHLSGQSSSPTRPLPTGADQAVKEIANYEIIQELGRGGMGIVYKARDKRFNRVVALKMLLKGEGTSMDELTRFIREVKITSQLDHPNIVKVWDAEDFPMPFFTMEFISGQTLSELIRSQLLTTKQTIVLFDKICSAIDYAHQQKVIHRDLKPGNIMIDQAGEPKVMDFGLAKRLDTTQSLSRAGDILGTPKYMSPEQADGKTVDKRSDIYSMGVILYEMLTFRTPFEGDSIFNILSQIANNDIIPPGELNPSIPLDLQTVCMKCLERNPKKRYFSVRLLKRDIELFLDNKPIKARPPGPLERLVKWTHRNKIGTGFILLVILSLCMAILALIKEKKAFEAVLEIQKMMLSKSYKQGCVAFHEQDWAGAIRNFQAAIEKNKEHGETHWMKACVHFITRDKENGLSMAQDSLKDALNNSKDPLDKAKIRLLMALCHADMGKKDEAKAAWLEAGRILEKESPIQNSLKQHLPEMGKRNIQPDPLDFIMPLPDTELTWENACYYLIMNLLPFQEAQDARNRLSTEEKRQQNRKNPARDKDFVLQEFYKIGYMLDSSICPWAQYLLDNRSNRHPYPSEVKDMMFYICNQDGKWILDMASPYWTRLPTELQQQYAALYQQGYAIQINRPLEYGFKCGYTVFDMVLIPPGQFLMGRPLLDEDIESPQHQLIIEQSFWMAKYEVTQEQWEAIETNPWAMDAKHVEKNPKNPASYVSWMDAQCLIQELNHLPWKGQKPSLPHEILWEYACRAGTTSNFYWGKKLPDSQHLWYEKNCQDAQYPHRVGNPSPPNGWKLYNMADNVSEWCSNSEFSYDKRRKIYSHEVGMKDTGDKVIRGGHFFSFIEQCRSSYRAKHLKEIKVALLGFRFVIE